MIIGQGLYSELVLLAARLNKVKEMKLLVEELGSFGELQLGLEHCTSIMAACRKSHMHDAVLSLFEWWKQAGFLPNVVMYQIVMTSLLDMGKPREALAIYWEMGKRGFAPHLPVYTALIDICVELKDVHRALRMLSHMKESNITPTGNIYKKLIKLCNQDGRFGKAKELAEAMRKEGLPIHDVEAHTDLCF
ncbi:hypothetical protein KP509_10G067400 [Ceratopteris richardii]|nr:hypothetical protein KP509_10G067400 [Ceratopteris richardii]